MAPRQKRGTNSLSSPSTAALRVPDTSSASSLPSPGTPGKYIFAVPPATHAGLLQILNGPEEFVLPHQIYNQNPSLFGEADSDLRKQVKNHRYYLERLRKSNEKKFNGFCAAQGVALRGAEQQDTSCTDPLTASMSRRNNRHRGKSYVGCGA
jgi:hypothetical protein